MILKTNVNAQPLCLLANLQRTIDIDRFSFGYCGNELIVKRSGGAITVAPIIQGLKGVKQGVDKTASELAITRLEGEIYSLTQQKYAQSPSSDFYHCLS